MKTINKCCILVALLSLFCGCEMNYYPSDALSRDALLQDEKGLTYLMDGCYSVLKDQVEYLGYASGNDYCRHYFQLSEYMADNICLCAPTTDPLYQALSYTMTDDLKNVGTLWMLAYKVIGMCNTVIETIDQRGGDKQLAGEAYFMRALMHLHMVTLYAKPYNFGRDNMGVPLRLASGNAPVTRATVGEVYDQIEKDLVKAAHLLSDKPRTNAGTPCKASAYGLLSRVYLYMGENEKVISVVNDSLNMAGTAIESQLESTSSFGTYFANAKTSKETLFCIAHEIQDNKGQGSVGSMYNGVDNGWGEIYPSNPLLYLYERYPMDVRYTAYIVPQYSDNASDDELWIYFPNPKPESDNSSRQTLKYQLFSNEAGYYFSDSLGSRYYAKQQEVAGGYKEWHLTYKNTDCLARVHKLMKTGNKDNNPQWFMLKFANQDGKAHLSSPVYLRWAEVLLNRAEAEAKIGGKDAEALADVNILRKRAGIPNEGWFSSVTDHGYTSALDIVLDERRLELAFEGHRTFDMMRNERNIDRRYPGANPWEIVPYNRERLQYPIPFAEWSVSGIAQNPGY